MNQKSKIYFDKIFNLYGFTEQEQNDLLKALSLAGVKLPCSDSAADFLKEFSIVLQESFPRPEGMER
jgi:hypothetical protein